MPFTTAQKQAAIAPCFAAARKPMADYIARVPVEVLHPFYAAVGAACLTRLVTAFYPDQFAGLKRDLNNAELTQLGRFTLPTLATFLLMDNTWVKAIMRTLASPGVYASQAYTLGAPLAGWVLNTHGALDQTSTQATLANTVLTELNGAGNAVRNLVFNAAGNCCAEVNFANHGGGAVSGHAHVYGVMCIPHTGHHAYGTPHVDMADYRAVWRQLPVGIMPATPLGT
ncbi:MAG TPA: hypothetical protein VF710_22565 [Longimicrobium sp.]|jgi:hypothetical protein